MGPTPMACGVIRATPSIIPVRAVCRSHKINARLSSRSALLEYADIPKLKPDFATPRVDRATRAVMVRWVNALKTDPRTAVCHPPDAAGTAASSGVNGLEQRHPGDYAQRYNTGRDNSGNHTGDTDIAERACCRAHPAPPHKSCYVRREVLAPVSIATPAEASATTTESICHPLSRRQ